MGKIEQLKIENIRAGTPETFCNEDFPDKHSANTNLENLSNDLENVIKSPSEQNILIDGVSKCTYNDYYLCTSLEEQANLHITESSMQMCPNPKPNERPFKCKMCERAFWKRNYLRRHEARHTGQNNRECKICFKWFSNLFNLKQHLRTVHHGETPYKCNICLREFSTKSSLTYHTRALHTSEKKFSCSSCNKTFFSAEQVKRHLQSHMDREHPCTICGIIFCKRDDMRNHRIAIHRPYVNYPPEEKENSNNFTKKSICDIAIKEEYPDYPVKCEDYGSLNVDSEIEIEERQIMEPDTIIRNKTSCTLCGKFLPTKDALSKHMSVHKREKPFKCDSCPKSFSLARILKAHKTAHRKGRLKPKVDCDICGKKLAHSNALQDHMRLHTGETPFNCNICEKSFMTRSFLKYHIKSQHTGERNYTCIQCGKSFLTKSHLQLHNLSHNKVKGIMCEICGKLFLNRSYVVQHKIDVHNFNSKDYDVDDLRRTSTCGICGKTMKSVSTIRRHILVKHMEHVKCECDKCGDYFADVDILIEHQQTTCPYSVKVKVKIEEEAISSESNISIKTEFIE